MSENSQTQARFPGGFWGKTIKTGLKVTTAAARLPEGVGLVKVDKGVRARWGRAVPSRVNDRGMDVPELVGA